MNLIFFRLIPRSTEKILDSFLKSSLKCTLITVFHFPRHTGQIVIKLIERRILNLSKCVISVMFL